MNTKTDKSDNKLVPKTPKRRKSPTTRRSRKPKTKAITQVLDNQDLSAETKEKEYEIAEKIFNLITYNSKTTQKACELAGISESYWYKLLRTNPELKQISIRAREIAGLRYGEKCAEVLEDVKNDKYDPQKGRLLFDGYLRLAGKMSQVWADKQTVDINIANKKGITDYVLDSIQEAEIIEPNQP